MVSQTNADLVLQHCSSKPIGDRGRALMPRPNAQGIFIGHTRAVALP